MPRRLGPPTEFVSPVVIGLLMRVRSAYNFEAGRGLGPHPQEAVGEAVVGFRDDVAQRIRLDAADDADGQARNAQAPPVARLPLDEVLNLELMWLLASFGLIAIM